MLKNLNRSYISQPCKGTKSENGVALIMVLGLLTVMIILAVTFAVSMRTERLAAGNYADTVRARELVHAGLARAMNDLAVNLGPTGLYQPDGKAYPDWSVTNSYYATPGGFPRWNTNIYLLTTDKANEATNYVPRVLWTAATNADFINSSKHWLPVERITTNVVEIISTNGGITTNLVWIISESNLMGRVAYLILNCSGLLDANYAGGATRQFGTNPAEIAIANLGEIGSVADFNIQRLTDIRYETVAELNALADFYKPASNLFVYSRALPGYWDANAVEVRTQVNLSGTAAELEDTDRRNAIISGFMQAGFSTNDAWTLYRNLIDYVDDNYEPYYYTWYVESVPMINEVAVSNSVVSLGGIPENFQSQGSIFIEWWHPFVKTNSASYQIQCSAGSITYVSGDLNLLPSLPSLPWSSASFSLPSTNIAFVEMPLTPSTSVINTVTFRTELTIQIVKDGAVVVDRNNDSPIVLTNICELTPRWASRQCLDPRFNNNPNDINQWSFETSPSLGLINPQTVIYVSTAPDCDGDMTMHVANAPLQSVAEIGYLMYSSNYPWRTVKLYGPDRHRVLDVFGLSKNTNYVFMTNTVYRGLVNCNPTEALDAAAVVFADMPVDQYPGETPPLGRLTMDDARIIVNRIFSEGFQTNVSDIWKISDFSGLSVPPANELQKEAFIRNTTGLLIARQNMFTIIIEAQVAYADGNVPRNPARQKAVAIVWRDPYTGEMFVRHLKWLGD